MPIRYTDDFLMKAVHGNFPVVLRSDCIYDVDWRILCHGRGLERGSASGVDFTHGLKTESLSVHTMPYLVDSSGAKDNVDMSKAKLWLANMTGANLELVGLNMVSATKVILTEAILKMAHISFSDFTRANLASANLYGAILYDVNLRYSYLVSALLEQVNCFGVNFKSADLRGANLKGAKFNACTFLEASYDSKTVWPEGFDPVRAGAILVD